MWLLVLIRNISSVKRLRRLSGLHAPAKACAPKAGAFNEVEETTVSEELFEVADRVATKLLILEIHRVPGALLAVQDVDCARFRIEGHQQEQQDRRWELDPANDLGLFSGLQECSDCGSRIGICADLYDCRYHHSTE